MQFSMLSWYVISFSESACIVQFGQMCNGTIQFPHKMQNKKKLQQHARVLHKAF